MRPHIDIHIAPNGLPGEVEATSLVQRWICTKGHVKYSVKHPGPRHSRVCETCTEEARREASLR